jgi:Cu(I)/Ag(I) efflux system membrane fusion protein
MAWGSGRDDQRQDQQRLSQLAESKKPAHVVYICPMHPQVRRDSPGQCPICGMNLVPAEGASPDAPAHGDAPVHEMPGARAHSHVSMTEMSVSASEAEMEPVKEAVRPHEDAAAPGPDVRVAGVEKRSVSQRVQTWGRVVADGSNERVVTAPADGWIRRLHVQRIGTRVAAMAPLFEFYSPELLQKQRDYIDLLNRRDQLTSSITDFSGQNGEVLGSLARERKRQRDELLRLGIAGANIDAIERFRRPLDALTIVSPYSGIVTSMNAREGLATGPAGPPLYSVLDDRSVQAEVVLTPAQMRAMAEPAVAEVDAGGETARVPLPLDRAIFTPALQSYVVRVSLGIASGRLLQPGDVLQVAVTGPARDAIAVPSEALLEGPDGAYVMVQADSGRFSPRRVRTGVRDRQWVEILAGLQAGEHIATEGQFMLDAAATLQTAIASAASQ